MAPGAFPARPFEGENTITKTTATTIQAAGIGFLFAATQASLAKRSVGLTGVFSVFGRTFGMFAAGGAAYQFVKSSSLNLRRQNDSWNAAFGGVAGGIIVGLFRGARLPSILGLGAGLAVVAAAHDMTGGLAGFQDGPESDRYKLLDQLRKNYRQPVAETIAEIGEGRGVYGPGYAERRRQLFRDKYGIEIPVYPAAADSYAAADPR